MRWRRLFILVGLSCALTGGPAPAGEPAAVEILREPFTPQPDARVRERWLRRIFDVDDVLWIFTDFEDFETMLAHGRLDEGLKVQLRARFQSRLTSDEFTATASWIPAHHLGLRGFVFVPTELWDRLPSAFIEHAYRHRLRTLAATPDASFLLDERRWPFCRASERRLSTALARHAPTWNSVPFLRHATILVGGEYHLLVTPATWPHLNDGCKLRLIARLVDEPARNALRCRVRLSRDNVVAIARTFAGRGDASSLERALRARLGDAPDALVDLAEVLPPFIRDHVNTFGPRAGPNCFNAGVNVNLGANYALGHTDELQFAETICTSYRAVAPEETLELGDLLVFSRRDRHGVRPWHVANYVAEDLLFTKNGLSKFNPYVFQTMDEILRRYFADGKFKLAVFRPIGDGEEAIGADYPRERYVARYVHPELEAARPTAAPTRGPLAQTCATLLTD